MSTKLLEKQLEGVSSGREKMTHVRLGDRAVVVLSQAFFKAVEPLLDYMAQRTSDNQIALDAWTDEKNARRASLVNKKYDSRLTTAEKAELATLDKEADQFLEQQFPVRNELLELMLAGLKQKARAKKTKS